MKNKIYLFGIILVILFTLGAIFKMMHWPGAGIVLVTSLSLFSLVFTPIAVINCYREEKKYAFVYLAGLITISFNFVGAMFKIMHWPGAGILLTIAIIIPFIYFLPAYLIYVNKSAEKSMKKLISVLFILVYIAAMDALLALNVSKVVIYDSALINEHYTLLAAYYENSADEKVNYADSANLDKLNSLSEKTDLFIEEINELKRNLIITASEDNEELFNEEEKINILKMDGMDNTYVSGQIMLNEAKAMDLKSCIDEYKEFLLGFADNQNSEMINKYLDTNDIVWEEHSYSWEDVHFGGTMMIWAVNYLTSLEFKARMLEEGLVASIANS